MTKVIEWVLFIGVLAMLGWLAGMGVQAVLTGV